MKRTTNRKTNSTAVRNILIVEDNQRCANDVAVILRGAGHNVTTCSEVKDVEECVKHAAKGKYDVALLDHSLWYGFDGKDMAKLLQLPKARLISISTGDFDTSYCGQMWCGKEAVGMRDCLEKARKALSKSLLMAVEAITK